jgi:large subunit ribosomal protein L6
VTEYKERQKDLNKIVLEIPKDVKITLDHNLLFFEKGSQKNQIKTNPVFIKIEIKDNNIILNPIGSKKRTRAVLNTTKKLIDNALEGLSTEYEYKLSVVYSHFPITVKTEGNFVLISNFLGEKRPRKTKILPGCKVEVKGKDIIVKGHSKYATGQTAGNIEKVTRVTKKDFRVFDDGCYIVEKPKINKNVK